MINYNIDENDRRSILKYGIAMQDGEKVQKWVVGKIVKALKSDRIISQRQRDDGEDDPIFTHDVKFTFDKERRGKELTNGTQFKGDPRTSIVGRGYWVLLKK